jgi:hypothetical protein
MDNFALLLSPIKKRSIDTEVTSATDLITTRSLFDKCRAKIVLAVGEIVRTLPLLSSYYMIAQPPSFALFFELFGFPFVLVFLTFSFLMCTFLCVVPK